MGLLVSNMSNHGGLAVAEECDDGACSRVHQCILVVGMEEWGCDSMMLLVSCDLARRPNSVGVKEHNVGNLWQ